MRWLIAPDRWSSGGDRISRLVQRLELRVCSDLVGAGDGRLNIGQDVFGADVFHELGTGDQFGGLIARSADEQGTPRSAEPIGEGLNGVEASRVQGGHVAEAKNDDGREGVDVR